MDQEFGTFRVSRLENRSDRKPFGASRFENESGWKSIRASRFENGAVSSLKAREWIRASPEQLPSSSCTRVGRGTVPGKLPNLAHGEATHHPEEEVDDEVLSFHADVVCFSPLCPAL